jgi:hypothetical protein
MIRKGMLRDRRASQMAEAAIVLPVILIAVGLQLDGVRAGAVSVQSCNAAYYGARVGSVAKEAPEGFALDATNYALANSAVRADSLQIGVFSSGNRRTGGGVYVAIAWKVETFFSGLCDLFGGICPRYIEGQCGATFKKEGW